MLLERFKTIFSSTRDFVFWTILSHLPLWLIPCGLRELLSCRRMNGLNSEFRSVGVQYISKPIPPFDITFYLPIESTFDQKYDRSIELANPNAARYVNLLSFTPYLVGKCNICGKKTIFFCKNMVFPRDYLICIECGSSSRYRSIARGILRAIKELVGVEAESLAELGDSHCAQTIRIYDTQVPFYLGVVSYPVPDILAHTKWISLLVSDYRPGKSPGKLLGAGITNQNLESLTFEDNSFDIVITSDVMEHIRLVDKAHREIRRILRPGGIYMFTVPHRRDVLETTHYVEIVDLSDPTKDQFVKEPVYHGDPNSIGKGSLVYQLFGTDLDQQLNTLGFSVEYSKDDYPEFGVFDSELFYCKVEHK